MNEATRLMNLLVAICGDQIRDYRPPARSAGAQACEDRGAVMISDEISAEAKIALARVARRKPWIGSSVMARFPEKPSGAACNGWRTTESLRRQKLPRPCAPATSSRFARSTG